MGPVSRDAECLRTLVHRPFGGAELELIDHMAVVRESRVPTGWWHGPLIGSAASAIPLTILGKLQRQRSPR